MYYEHDDAIITRNHNAKTKTNQKNNKTKQQQQKDTVKTWNGR